MRQLISFLLVLACFAVKAQNFEGTIQWSMKMDITDPEMKAKMEAAQKRMQDPAEQAKMKKMQEQMNDPQMKAMMEANPAMKAQMENAMKMMQSGDMSNMMPKGFTVKVKNQNILTLIEGGPMPMEMLYLKDKNQTYHLDRANKTYSVMNAGEHKGQSADAPKVTKTSETAKILNYNCTKYIVEMKEGDKTLTENIWTTTEIKDIDLKAMAKQRMARGHSFMVEGVDGVPLKVEAGTQGGNMVMEVTQIKKESLNAADFTVPSDFKETQGMYGGMH